MGRKRVLELEQHGPEPEEAHSPPCTLLLHKFALEKVSAVEVQQYADAAVESGASHSDQSTKAWRTWAKPAKHPQGPLQVTLQVIAHTCASHGYNKCAHQRHFWRANCEQRRSACDASTYVGAKSGAA